ncbi:MAG: (2Fe-2S) ferredoxin domain-containing protein, partial [Nitrospirota bacterium]
MKANNNTTIRVCMGTGGIAAGGAEVLNAFKKELNLAGIKANVEKNCSMHKVGCRGLCAKDVLVDVIINDEKTTYQFIKSDMVPRI